MADGNGTSGRILVVDDEPSVRESVGYALEQEGFQIGRASCRERVL